MRHRYSVLFLLSACTALTPGSLRAQLVPTFNLLYTFKAQGGYPGALVEVQPGRFFGIVSNGPGIFSITSAGSYQYFYVFPPQRSGLAVFGLTPALNGQVYGSAANLGTTLTFSELFSVTPNDKVATYSYANTQGVPFDQIQSPYGLYGFIGAPGGLTFDRFDYKGNATPLYTFPAGSGKVIGAPFLGLDGAFYGMMISSNTSTVGIFRITASGAFSWVVPSFSTGGVYYTINLIQASNGNFYGTVPGGVSGAGGGSIYEVTPSGQMTTLYQFPNKVVGIPETLLEASDGMIYGTTRGLFATGYNGYSSLFQLNPSTGQVKTVFSFQNVLDGECECSIVQGSDGKLYGGATNFGEYQLGTLFS